MPLADTKTGHNVAATLGLTITRVQSENEVAPSGQQYTGGGWVAVGPLRSRPVRTRSRQRDEANACRPASHRVAQPGLASRIRRYFFPRAASSSNACSRLNQPPDWPEMVSFTRYGLTRPAPSRRLAPRS